VEGPAVSFCPSDLAAPNKSRRPQLVIPSVPGFPTSRPYQRQRVRLSVESRMKSTEATVFDRKSGAAEGPAVRPGSRTMVSLPLVLPQTRHPACPGVPRNRSAAQRLQFPSTMRRGLFRLLHLVLNSLNRVPKNLLQAHRRQTVSLAKVFVDLIPVIHPRPGKAN
jgi:hypothetical protein